MSDHVTELRIDQDEFHDFLRVMAAKLQWLQGYAEGVGSYPLTKWYEAVRLQLATLEHSFEKV